MNISQNKENSFGLKSTIPFFTILFLIIVMVLPYKFTVVGDIMPFLTLIGVYYWSVFKPELLPVSVVFVLGLFQDILLGSPLGLMSLLLVVVQQFIFFQGRQFLERDFLLTSLYFRAVLDYWGVIGQILLTIAFYPIITWILGLAKKMVS